MTEAGKQPLPPAVSATSDVLLIDSEAITARLVPILRCNHRVVAASSTIAIARAFLARTRVDVIVTAIELPDGAAIDLCREAKSLPGSPAVLVTTAEVERVPDALDARCDGVLLKPFAPNLLVGRISRLIRERAQHDARRNTHTGTNWFWPETSCPYCEVKGVTTFEFASRRRAWYACGKCKKVWLGKRQE